MLHNQQSDHDLLASGRANLIPRSQVLDIKEGLFSEDDIRQMENGFSVSDSDTANDDLSSMRSGHSGIMMDNMNGSIQSPQLYDHHPRPQRLLEMVSNHPESHHVNEHRVRTNAERSMLQNEIVQQKGRHLKKMTKLERLLSQLTSEKRDLQHVIETQKHNFTLQLKDQEQKTQEQLRDIKEQQYKLQGQVPNFKEKLELYKKEFSSSTLLVSEETYVELKSKPEHQQSLKDFLQVKIYESLDKYQSEIDNLRRENDEIAEINMQMKLKCDRDQRDLESMRKLMSEREEDSRRKMDAQERRTKELENDLHRVNQQFKVVQEKGLSAKEIDEKYRQMEVDHRSLQSQYKLLEEQLNRVQSVKLDTDKRCDQYRRELDLLNQDKTFLSRENIGLEERLKRMEEKLDRNETELLDSKRQCSQYMDRVLSTNDDVKSKFEREYSQEINDLKERHNRELEMSKNNLTEIYEKRIEYMRERKEEFERRTLKLEQDLSDKSQSYQELLVEIRQLQRTTDEEIGRLKLGVMSKSDECRRMQSLYEDNIVMVKDMKIENEALKSKIDILKSEYYKLESTHRQGNADIKAELAVSKERLASYELIEKELDQAIMHVANNDNAEQVDAIGNALIQTITSAPTHAKRRIQQSLLLANRLQTKQRETEQMTKEIRELKGKLESQEAEVKFHKRMMEKTGQPAQYMMADIEKSEKEIMFANKKIKKLEDEIKRLYKENETLILQKKGLNEDLQKLLSRRQDIDTLYTTLQGVISHSTSKKIDLEDLKFKLAESVRSNIYRNQSTAANSFGQKESNIMKTLTKNKSKSPGKFIQGDQIPERGSAVKMYQESDPTPAWYKALKSKVQQQ